MKLKAQVLIVDDNDDVREVLAMILEAAGYDTAEARNGCEAIELARQTMPDVILMDVFMPELDGIRASEIIRGEASPTGVPIILQTARASAAREHEELFFEVLPKPSDPDAVLESLDRALANRPPTRTNLVLQKRGATAKLEDSGIHSGAAPA
jgi:CheY-like chemotaxis protein